MVTLFLIMGSIFMLILSVVGLTSASIAMNGGNILLGLFLLGMAILPAIAIVCLLGELGII